MSTVMLTGATGFVGRAIHRYLAQAGYAVRVTVRPGAQHRLAASAETIQTDDIFSQGPQWWAEACAGVDAVIHAAWYVEHGKYLDAPENAACVSGSFALAQGAAMAGVRHVIGLGTCMEYRLPGEALSVDSPLEPANFYAACKVSAFHQMREWLAQSDTAFSWCRLFYLHGADEHPDRIGAYLHRTLRAGEVARMSAGTQLRDFLNVREAGAMIANVLETGQTGVINICSGKAQSVRHFAETIADHYGRRDLLEFGTQPPRPGDPAAVVGVCNLEKSPKLLEFL